MKLLIPIFLFLNFFSYVHASINKPAVWGKIVKTKEKKIGYYYFIYFKKDGIDYAFPLSSKSKISQQKLENLNGKYAKIYGEEKFEDVGLEASKLILTFEVQDAIELKLSDLNQDLDSYSDRLNIEKIHKKFESDVYVKKGLSNKAINTAILIGGTILAADVLSVLLTN